MIHLHCHSHYSFLSGTLSIPRLLDLAADRGCRVLALTDVNTVTGMTEFMLGAGKRSIQAIPGAELRAGQQRVVLLAASAIGWRTICDAVTIIAAAFPPARIRETQDDEGTRQDDTTNGETFSDTLHPALVEALTHGPLRDVIVLTPCIDVLRLLSTVLPRTDVFAELLPSEEGRWYALQSVAATLGIGVVAAADVMFGDRGGRELHRILRAIATNTTLGTLRESELAHQHQWFFREEGFLQHYSTFPEALENRRRIADRCLAEFDFTSSKFVRYDDRPRQEHAAQLRALARAGLESRYGIPGTVHRERLERELDIIERLGFVDYFLVTWDMIRYATHRNFPYVGRGSGANSIVAYCLRITNVDPIELNLFFERFLNPERRSPPDFDIDFSWRNRDEVIDYLLGRYGRDRTAMICTISTFNPRGAIRESGKVFGFSDAEIREAVRYIPGYASVREFRDPDSPFRRHALSIMRSPYGRRWIHVAERLLDFPNHFGIHSGGVILAPEPLSTYTASQIAPKGVRITQQDMFGMEDWRLEKLDVLSTRGLGVFEDTMRAVELRTGSAPPILDYRVACDDEATRALMRRGDTIGCFYVESPAMIQLLRKLRTDTFEMLTAASSIIRPGVAQSGMMQAFIERYHDRTKIQPPHPRMAELLADTFGVMVYQEDVIKVAHFIGGLSLGEADVLRRAMSGKMRSKEAMAALRDMFHAGCERQSIPHDVAAEIWRQMESFAGYSFCKAHSASYAVLSFQEAWLKSHYPALFLCGVLNNQGGYYRPEVYVQEARRLGITVRLPDVQESEYLNTCPDDHSIQLGFLHVKHLTDRAVESILGARSEGGAFLSLEDFLSRTGMTRDDAERLVQCGACDRFGLKRTTMMAQVKLLLRRPFPGAHPGLGFTPDLFDEDLSGLKNYSSADVSRIELEAFEFTVTRHVLDHYARRLAGAIRAVALPEHVGRRVVVGGWMVAAKMTRTRKGERMMFINLDDATGMIDVVLFPACYAKYGHILHGAGPYRVEGRAIIEYGVVSVSADRIIHLGAPESESEGVPDKTTRRGRR